MPDINEWQLTYAGVLPLTFGTMASEFPFQSQVDISAPDADDQDSNHPNSDGLVMGIDRLGGMTLTFDCIIPPEYWRLVEGEKWVTPMNMYGAFAARWRADSIRRISGSYASLANINRNRMVFGRPRKCAPKYARVRKGEVSWLADFKTVDPNFYSINEYLLNVSAGAVVSSAGLGSSLPGGGIQPGGSSIAWTVGGSNPGELPTWPTVEFGGVGSITCLDGVTNQPLWTLTTTLANVVIDTRPWARSVRTVAGQPANGRVTGTRIELCQLPPGLFTLKFTGSGTTKVRWRDAYAAL